MSAAAGNNSSSPRAAYDRLSEKDKKAIDRLLIAQKSHEKQIATVSAMARQTQGRINHINMRLGQIAQVEHMLALGEEGMRTRGAPENYARHAKATELLATFEKREDLQSDLDRFLPHLARLQSQLAALNAELAEIKRTARAILASAHGGRRRTRAHRKAKRGTRKHR